MTPRPPLFDNTLGASHDGLSPPPSPVVTTVGLLWGAGGARPRVGPGVWRTAGDHMPVIDGSFVTASRSLPIDGTQLHTAYSAIAEWLYRAEGR